MKDYFIIAIGSLRKRFLRTSLTMLGIFIGIAAVVALISLGQGMQEAVNGRFASVGADKVIVQGASATFAPPGQNAAGTVDEDDLDLIERTPGVKRVAGRLFQVTNLEYNDIIRTNFATSLPEKTEARDLILEALNAEVEHGRMLKASETKKIILGYEVWEGRKFNKEIKLGKKILVNDVAYQVVGLLKKGGPADRAIFMNENDLRDLVNERHEFSVIIAQADKGVDPEELANKIHRIIRRDRGQKEGFEDFTVQTSQELIDSIRTVLSIISFVFIGIALISLFVGGIGIMNTMYTSVMERTREIGIMKAIGARNSDILKIFLIESGLLGLVGGAIGILLGILMSKLVETIGRGVLGELLQAHFPLPLILGALGFSVVVGTISGVFPARQAAKLPPVEALRSD